MITLEPPRSLADEADPWQKQGLSASGLARFLNRARAAVGIKGEVHVLLADDATLKRLNKTFRGKNKATDVLSFPAEADFGGPEKIAGDLAISVDTARRQGTACAKALGAAYTPTWRVPGNNNTIMSWKIASDGSVTNGLA